ncbi:MAG: APC family permease [Gemmatimonadales bacterium]
MTTADSSPPVGYARRLGLFSGTMSVVGGIIGAGIFLNPAIVAARVGSAELTLGVWIVGGVVAILGGFIYGELGRRLPKAGGPYAYLRAAYGPLPGFLYAWALLLIMGTGAAAAVGYTFASYAANLFHLSEGAILPLAAIAIAGFALLNVFGVEFGAWTQNVFVLLKLAALGLLVVAGLFFAPAGPPPAVSCVDCAPLAPPIGLLATIAAVGAALVPVLFSYGGWQQSNYIAEELIEPERNLPRALVIGVTIVVVGYLLANVAYLEVLGVEGLARSTAPAADTLQRTFGEGGRRLISFGVMLSTAGFLNTITLLAPRVYQAMARDRLFFESFARLHPRFRTPVVAILFQAAWAILLLMLGTYGRLLDYVVFADWIFFGSTAAAVIVLRRRDGPPTGGFLAPGYPATVLVFVAAALYVVIGSIISNPGNALRGIALLALGVPVCWWWARKAAAAKR